MGRATATATANQAQEHKDEHRQSRGRLTLGRAAAGVADRFRRLGSRRPISGVVVGCTAVHRVQIEVAHFRASDPRECSTDTTR